MDGNGRWAERRGMPRSAGHQAGVGTVRSIIEASLRHGVEVVTLFAFSSENWRRPKREVSVLMDLFLTSLRREVKRLDRNGVQLRIIGDRSALSDKLQAQIAAAEQTTAGNERLVLCVATNYGGRWDLVEAARVLARRVASGELDPDAIDEQAVNGALSLADLPTPDLLIRTGGESRISNFLLWQLAYSELYFTDTLWPEFDDAAYAVALKWYAGRERRYGKTPGQVQQHAGA